MDKKQIIGSLEVIIRASGDDKLNIDKFYNKLVWELKQNSIEFVHKVNEIPISLLLAICEVEGIKNGEEI